MTEPRASTTDPQARRMRFADGAMRPGYNVQVAVTADHGLITAIEATDRRQNTGLAKPMIEVTEARLGCHVKRLLADTVYASQDDIEALATRAEFPVTSYVALPEARADVKPASLAERARKRAREPASIKDWRLRMQTEAAKLLLKKRAGIERVNAQLKRRGLARLTVRGLVKVRAVVCLQALAHNFTTGLRLLAAQAAAAAQKTTAAAA